VAAAATAAATGGGGDGGGGISATKSCEGRCATLTSRQRGWQIDAQLAARSSRSNLPHGPTLHHTWCITLSVFRQLMAPTLLSPPRCAPFTPCQ
jgi:hypothetical protein